MTLATIRSARLCLLWATVTASAPVLGSQAVCTPLPAPSPGLQAALEASGESSF
ncbi:hypothetical protein [Lelliottia jeotgali]